MIQGLSSLRAALAQPRVYPTLRQLKRQLSTLSEGQDTPPRKRQRASGLHGSNEEKAYGRRVAWVTSKGGWRLFHIWSAATKCVTMSPVYCTSWHRSEEGFFLFLLSSQ